MNTNKNDPRLIEALTLFHQGKSDEATLIVQTVLKESLENPEALQILGQITHGDNNFDVARDLFKESLKLDPEQAHVWDHLGNVLNDLREPEEASKALHKAIELNPTFGKAYQQLASINLSRGDREEGLAFARKSLEVNPELLGNYMVMAKAKSIKSDDPLVDKMEKLLKKNQGQKGPCGMLHYALSYVYEQAGETEHFFFHLNKANQCNKPEDDSWKGRLEKRFENLKTVMTPEFLAAKVSETNKIYTPIFIVGMPRSGTTLTDQIFATHSQCFGGDELQYFTKYLNRVVQFETGDSGVKKYPELQMEHLAQISNLYQQRVQLLSPGSQFISDKMPWNFHQLGMISKILPWAKIIHIHRDPLDCGLSCYRVPLPNKLEFTCDMEDYAFYRSKYQEVMDFWQEIIPDSFINLSYEKMVDNPEKELRRVLDYCGLPWEDELLNFHKTKRQVRTISSDQVNKPLNKSSIGRARKYEKQLVPMIKALEGYGLIRD